MGSDPLFALGGLPVVLAMVGVGIALRGRASRVKRARSDPPGTLAP